MSIFFTLKELSHFSPGFTYCKTIRLTELVISSSCKKTTSSLRTFHSSHGDGGHTVNRLKEPFSLTTVHVEMSLDRSHFAASCGCFGFLTLNWAWALWYIVSWRKSRWFYALWFFSWAGHNFFYVLLPVEDSVWHIMGKDTFINAWELP